MKFNDDFNERVFDKSNDFELKVDAQVSRDLGEQDGWSGRVGRRFSVPDQYAYEEGYAKGSSQRANMEQEEERKLQQQLFDDEMRSRDLARKDALIGGFGLGRWRAPDPIAYDNELKKYPPLDEPPFKR